MVLKVKKEAIDSHGWQMTLVPLLDTRLHCGERGGTMGRATV